MVRIYPVEDGNNSGTYAYDMHEIVGYWQQSGGTPEEIRHERRLV
jgi:hypothetical protein